MSQTVTSNTGQQLFVDTLLKKIFLWDNRFNQEVITNATGAAVTIEAGTVLGRISASGKLVAFTTAAVDGSQNPVGILNDTKIIPANSDLPCFNCVSGDVASEYVLFGDASTLDTVVSGRRLRDIIVANTGIKLTPGVELTNFDNS